MGTEALPMNVFTFKDYRALLHAVMEERKPSGLSYQQLAQAAGVQKSYFSKVLHGSAELSQDQLFLLADYLGWSAHESDFVQLLLELSRCGLPKRKKALEARIEKMRKSRGGDRLILPEDSAKYFLDPIAQLLHKALLIPRYGKDLELLARDLKIDLSVVQKSLEVLFSLGIIERKGERLVVLVDHLEMSPQFQKQVSQIRRLAALKQESGDKHNLIFTADEETKAWLVKEMKQLMSRLQERQLRSKADDLYEFSLDLIAWTNV